MEIDVDKILAEIKRAVSIAQNEREVQARDSSIIENEIAKKLGNVPVGRYEYTFISGSRKRADYLYGHVIIEYKAPGKLSRDSEIVKAKEQIIDYIKREAEVEERYGMFLGIIFQTR